MYGVSFHPEDPKLDRRRPDRLSLIGNRRDGRKLHTLLSHVLLEAIFQLVSPHPIISTCYHGLWKREDFLVGGRLRDSRDPRAHSKLPWVHLHLPGPRAISCRRTQRLLGNILCEASE